MNIVDKKPKETPPNIFYGVDVNDKKAVKRELHRRQFRRVVGNFIFLTLFAIACVFAYDAIRVNFMDKHPMFYIKENIDGGVLYKGIGYSKLYCNDGNSYPYLNKQNKCATQARTFSQAFYSSFKAYAVNNKIIDDNKIKTIKLSNIRVDSTNDLGGNDYLVDFSFTCLDDSSSCFKKLKKQNDEFNYVLYVSLDNDNAVQRIFTFKPYGNLYDELEEFYSDRVKQYLIDNDNINEEILSTFDVRLLSNHGKVKYKGEQYADSYTIKINYSCTTETTECINFKEFSYDKYLDFEAAMLVDEEGNVKSITNKAVFGE